MNNTIIDNKEKKGINKRSIEHLNLDGENYFKIAKVDQLAPFFMSIVSPGNHWMFIGSNGGISAGRKNAEFSLFPYYTVDKILESTALTGNKSIFHIQKNGNFVWEPFSVRNKKKYEITRNVYKSIYGNSIIFEEINETLSLCYKYQWSSSAKYGFVKTSSLKNIGEEACEVSMLDGLQNIMPAGVGSELQNNASNLVDAYKRSELHVESGVGIYALSAKIVDKAEPREALKANVVWSIGVKSNIHLLSSTQLNKFRNNLPLESEVDVKGEKGAYFIKDTFEINKGETKQWQILANVNLSQVEVVNLCHEISTAKNLAEKVAEDIKLGTEKLIKLNASADGLQKTTDPLNDARHFANVLFNIMRGGVPDNNYQIEKNDFNKYLYKGNKTVFQKYEKLLSRLPEQISLFELRKVILKEGDLNLKRLSLEYLPLKFSRRHGDPSRPWNKFSINTQSEVDGSKILDYEGNWRDIFQNWEALAHSYPEFIKGMIFKFLNASTFDGYNPYRVTKDGFDWETIEADDPWSYIGYWGDHQIIYLLKFLEFANDRKPGMLQGLFNEELFVYANVPYKIKPYKSIINDPKDTIVFDEELDKIVRLNRDAIGADGALLTDEKGQIYHVNFIEKLLATVLAKISNLIPEGGVWMNTQRPEWNDANNALVGNGVSMVTLYYLHRFFIFFQELLENTSVENVKISSELMDCYKGVRKILLDHEHLLASTIGDQERMHILDSLGEVASDYRSHIYKQGFWGKKRSISVRGLKNFTRVTLLFLQQTIAANKRKDNLYHAYNLMTRNEEGILISYLSEMLEGQAAILSAKYLKPKEALSVLDGLKNSALFREDQYSYILYPNKELKGFLEKNIIPSELISSSQLLSKLDALKDRSIIDKDIHGKYYFNGNFAHSNDLSNALDAIQEASLKKLVVKEKSLILEIFETVFNHKAFTGRSGTFFGYEGLGSIYWHMVSKLLLATQECCLQAIAENESKEVIGRLMEHYYEIQAGIGVHKSPETYGAFPTDPYSHTPAGRGAQQPGMTGQVKEDVLAHWGELGVFVIKGELYFKPSLLREEEFSDKELNFRYFDVQGSEQSIKIAPWSLAFTYCQVPVVYTIAADNKIVIKQGEDTISIDGSRLDTDTSNEIFGRSGKVHAITVFVKKEDLR